MSFLQKYCPARLDELRGQARAVALLTSFAREPTPKALLLTGPSGCGKTVAARLTAQALLSDAGGLPFDRLEDFLDYQEVQAGEEEPAALRARLDDFIRYPPWRGPWKVLLLNDLDAVATAAEHALLRVTDRLAGPRVLLITSTGRGLPDRLTTRCEEVALVGTAPALLPHAQQLVEAVWRRETGPRGRVPTVASLLPAGQRRGTLSFRVLLTALEQRVRLLGQPAAAAPAPRKVFASLPAKLRPHYQLFALACRMAGRHLTARESYEFITRHWEELVAQCGASARGMRRFAAGTHKRMLSDIRRLVPLLPESIRGLL